MKKDKWIWMPHAGHFILGHQCQFKLNTYVGKYVVSTVGEMWNDQAVRRIHAGVFDAKWYLENVSKRGDEFDYAYKKRFGFEEIGCGRKYETMVFKARKSKYKCCPYEMISGKDVDFEGYNTPEEAYKGHLKLCKKWGKK